MNQPLDSRQLRAFYVLAKVGSFTKAGQDLFLSQSAVSHSVKALEEEVGCRLFDRVGKKVALTQCGEQLMTHAEKILQEMEAARGALKQLGRWGQGRLRIGASSTACQYILPGVLRAFKAKFPRYHLSIQPSDGAEAIDLLRQRKIDVALAMEPKGEDGLTFRPLFQDELMFLTDPEHPWAVAGRAARDEIAQQQYVLYDKNSYTFRLISEYFSRERLALDAVIELGSMDAIKELAKLGMGVSILAPWIARKEIQERALVSVPLGRRRLKRSWGLLYWKSRCLSLAEETFITLCQEATQSLCLEAPAEAAQAAEPVN